MDPVGGVWVKGLRYPRVMLGTKLQPGNLSSTGVAERFRSGSQASPLPPMIFIAADGISVRLSGSWSPGYGCFEDCLGECGFKLTEYRSTVSHSTNKYKWLGILFETCGVY